MTEVVLGNLSYQMFDTSQKITSMTGYLKTKLFLCYFISLYPRFSKRFVIFIFLFYNTCRLLLVKVIIIGTFTFLSDLPPQKKMYARVPRMKK